MANLKSLKSYIKLLKETFTEDHERFRILQTTADQFTCQFIGKNGKKIDIHAMIPDLYPSELLIWYTDSDDASIMDIVSNLSENNKNQNIPMQIDILLRNLCRLYNFEVPSEARTLLHGEGSSELPVQNLNALQVNDNATTTDDSDSDEDCQDENGQDETVDIDSDHDETVELYNTLTEIDDFDSIPTLKKARAKLLNNNEDNKSGLNLNKCTNRLMKEMREIYRSDCLKNGNFTVDLVNDNLCEWNIHLRSVDQDSDLYKDLLKLKEKEGIDNIQLNVTFNDKYPIEPPFVRIVYPIITCKHVVGGGAICTELLLKQCWSPAYTVESVIMQVAALLVKGNARIAFDSKKTYDFLAAKAGFYEVISAKQTGWFDRFKESS